MAHIRILRGCVVSPYGPLEAGTVTEVSNRDADMLTSMGKAERIAREQADELAAAAESADEGKDVGKQRGRKKS